VAGTKINDMVKALSGTPTAIATMAASIWASLVGRASTHGRMEKSTMASGTMGSRRATVSGEVCTENHT